MDNKGIITSIDDEEFEFVLGRRFGESELSTTAEPDVLGFELDLRGAHDLHELERSGWKILRRRGKRFLIARWA